MGKLTNLDYVMPADAFITNNYPASTKDAQIYLGIGISENIGERRPRYTLSDPRSVELRLISKRVEQY